MAAVRTRIVRMGKSQRVRIPKLMLEQVGIGDWVELEVVEGRILVRPVPQARVGWAEQFDAMHEAGDDVQIDNQEAVSTWDAA